MTVRTTWKMMVTCLLTKTLIFKQGESCSSIQLTVDKCSHMCVCACVCVLISSDNDEVSGDVGITDDKKMILERVRMNTRKEYLEGTTSGSVRATDRLMRELQDIYRSKCLKDGETGPISI